MGKINTAYLIYMSEQLDDFSLAFLSFLRVRTSDNNQSLDVPREGYGDYLLLNNEKLRDLFVIGTTHYRIISVG